MEIESITFYVPVYDVVISQANNSFRPVMMSGVLL